MRRFINDDMAVNEVGGCGVVESDRRVESRKVGRDEGISGMCQGDACVY